MEGPERHQRKPRTRPCPPASAPGRMRSPVPLEGRSFYGHRTCCNRLLGPHPLLDVSQAVFVEMGAQTLDAARGKRLERAHLQGGGRARASPGEALTGYSLELRAGCSLPWAPVPCFGGRGVTGTERGRGPRVRRRGGGFGFPGLAGPVSSSEVLCRATPGDGNRSRRE
jgi:hypothetical protein